MEEQDATEVEIPRAIALAWGVAANPSRGPKRELSIERIVDTAIELADEGGGLGAVSMSSVASKLGFTPMSLYRYVSAKDDLVLLMQEHALGIPPEEVREAEDWHDGLERWSRAIAAEYREHPWVLDIPITGTGVTPNSLAWLDAALEVLAPVPLEWEEKVSIILALLAQSRFEGLVLRGHGQAAREQGGSIDEVGERDTALVGQLVTAAQFPEVRRAFDAGAFHNQGRVADPFRFGNARLLDGIEAAVAGRSAPLPLAAAPDPLDEAAGRDPKVKEAVKARREAEKALREARKREREQRAAARERAARAAAKR